MSRYRFFTITDYYLNLEFYKDLYATNKVSFIFLGNETCPKTGRKHLQGYIYFKDAKSFSTVRDKTLKGRHIEIMQSDSGHNYTYCSKEKIALELGTRPAQGERNDLKTLKSLIESRASDKEIFESRPMDFIRYQKGIEAAKNIYAIKRNWKMDVRIYWGMPNTGKSRSVYDEFSSIYEKMPGKWWDRYNNEDTVLIDDFDPHDDFGLTFDFYLKLLDRYPMKVEVKGGCKEFCSKTIIITSNFNPDTWFCDKENRDAFFRRITMIKEFK